VSELIVVDLVIFALLIMIATVIVVSRGRRSSRRAWAARGTVAEPAAGPTYPREPITPGLHADPVPPDPGAHEPAGAEQAGPEPAEPEQTEAERAALQAAEPDQAEPEDAEPEQTEAERAEPGPAEVERAEPPQASEVPTADPGSNGSAAQPDGPAAEPGGRPGDAQPVASNEPIGSYYEGADQPIADYLAERGWPQEPGTHDPAGHA